MKFAQVPVGRRFELEGTRYLKTSPVVAVEEASGRSRFIGKYVEVTLSAEREAAAPQAPAPVDAGAVLAGLEAYHARCLAILDAFRGRVDAVDSERARAELEEARKRFVAGIGGSEAE